MPAYVSKWRLKSSFWRERGVRLGAHVRRVADHDVESALLLPHGAKVEPEVELVLVEQFVEQHVDRCLQPLLFRRVRRVDVLVHQPV